MSVFKVARVAPSGVPSGPASTVDVGAIPWSWRGALRKVAGVLMVLLSIVPVAGLGGAYWLARHHHPAKLWSLVIAVDSTVAGLWYAAYHLQGG